MKSKKEVVYFIFWFIFNFYIVRKLFLFLLLSFLFYFFSITFCQPKRWQEYTEELYKKGLNDLDNHEEAQMVKTACNAGDAGSMPGSGRSPGGGNG